MIAIIGGLGFLGAGIFNYCKSSNIECKVITRSNYEKLKGSHFKILINASTNSKKYLSVSNPQKDFYETVHNVHNSLFDFTYEKYVLISSGDVYPNIDESHEYLINNSIHQSNYGFNKTLAEECVRHYAKNWLIFRLGE